METIATTSLNTSDLLKLILGTGLFSALVSQVIGWFIDWQKDKKTNSRMAQYSALRIAVDMESFAINCAKAISDNDLFIQFSGHAGTQHSKIPTLVKYPDDVDWRSMDASLCARILSFRNEIELSQELVDSWYEFDYECIPSSCSEQIAICGYRSWALASDLRSFYKLPSFHPEQLSWDVEAILKNPYDKAMTRLKESG